MELYAQLQHYDLSLVIVTESTGVHLWTLFLFADLSRDSFLLLISGASKCTQTINLSSSLSVYCCQMPDAKFSQLTFLRAKGSSGPKIQLQLFILSCTYDLIYVYIRSYVKNICDAKMLSEKQNVNVYI